ncbi:uncharacterized protein VTP21DRAFT_10943 [Calcarisporiella thermophila]|uniref:uncharacterized protein n=1 Tax=Calcarisporiella thermophila TaxID=911321 RepID=UPI00374414CE
MATRKLLLTFRYTCHHNWPCFAKSLSLLRANYQPSTRHVSILSNIRDVFSKRTILPPVAKRISVTETHFGRERTDEYKWMEEDNTELEKYIEEENLYTSDAMKRTNLLQRILQREMRKKLRTPKIMPPITTYVSGYEYYSRTNDRGIVYCRRRVGTSNEEILLDSNHLPPTASIRKVLISHDQRVFAYAVEYEGAEVGTVMFRALDDGSNFKDDILHDVFNFVWSGDNKYMYYTVPDEQLRPCKVYAHRIGTPQSEDMLIYEEKDQSVFVDIGSTKDKKYITIDLNTLSSSEVRVLNAHHDFANGAPQPQVIEPRQEGVEYYVDHHENQFYILTNTSSTGEFKLVQAPDEQPSRVGWTDLFSVGENEKIEDVDIFKDFLVIYGRRDGLPVIKCCDLRSMNTHEVPLPEKHCVVGAGTNLEYDTEVFRFTIDSPFAHESTWEYDMGKRKLKPVRLHPIYGFDRSEYDSTQIHATSEDGTKVPITLLFKKGIKLNGANPVLLTSYGAYGISTDAKFRLEHFPLLERRWVIALAHVRGGGELGRRWYEAGKLDNKENSFKDLSAVGEHLIKAGLTKPQKMAALGASAGGLLVGGMLHLRPNMFRAVVLRVPFVDPLSAMLNPDLPLTRVEYSEWGNPAVDEKAYDVISRYSPYENVPTGRQETSVLVTGGMKDQRVACWQPLKLVARMRARQQSETPKDGKNPERLVLAKVEGRGHFVGEGGGQEQRLKDLAFELAFLITNIQENTI